MFFFFWQNTSCIRKLQVISGGGGGGGVQTPCTLPLDPLLTTFILTRKNKVSPEFLFYYWNSELFPVLNQQK